MDLKWVYEEEKSIVRTGRAIQIRISLMSMLGAWNELMKIEISYMKTAAYRASGQLDENLDNLCNGSVSCYVHFRSVDTMDKHPGRASHPALFRIFY